MFKNKFMQILQSLGFVDKAKKDELSEEDWKQIDAAFKKEHGKSMTELMEDNSNNEELAKERATALSLLNATAEEKPATETTEVEEEGEEKPEVEDKTSIVEGIKDIQSKLAETQKENKSIKDQMDKMAKQAKPETPMSVVSKKLHVGGPGHTETHLFGIENNMFSMESRWNKIAKNPQVAKLADASKQDAKDFQIQTENYGAALAKRYAFLKDNNLLNAVKENASFANDLSDLSNAGLGDQYITLRQDALIARILTIPTVYDLFPRRYGVQDREAMTIAYFDELSQAYQAGHVFKGGMKLVPEFGYVDDAMFKTEFGPMKEIERQYIGYLNTDGSDPMKWGMIEWQLLNMYSVLVNEQNTRVVRGCYVKPETGVAGSYLNAGTGLIYSLQRYYHENKLNPHSDELYNDYTATTMLDAVTAFIEDVVEHLDEDNDLEKKHIYLNKRHLPWWKKAIRAKFGKDTDFTGVDSYANVVPDLGVRIKWVPNMGNLKLMFIQEHGNLQALEFVPGEMLAVDFDKAMELMHVWSTWKEGFSGFIVGKQFDTLENMKLNLYSGQEIFMNHPASALAKDATTVDASKNFWFKSVDNAAATTITDITGAKKGVVYVIETGNATNPSKIAKTGRFASITAWTPTKVGDYIMVVLGSDDKFIELERRVAGSRTINVLAQPNIPGGRA